MPTKNSKLLKAIEEVEKKIRLAEKIKIVDEDTDLHSNIINKIVFTRWCLMNLEDKVIKESLESYKEWLIKENTQKKLIGKKVTKLKNELNAIVGRKFNLKKFKTLNEASNGPANSSK